MKEIRPHLYVLANKNNSILYIGTTSDLMARISQHKQKLVKGFTSKYNVDKLVYYEEFTLMGEALLAEKRMKRWHRQWKIELIEKQNPNWRDLFLDFF